MFGKRKFQLGAFVLAASLALTACGGGGAQSPAPAAPGGNEAAGPFAKAVTFKYANITKEKNAYSKVGFDIEESLKAATDGRVTFQHFPAGQLGNEADMMQQLNSGSLDFAVITTAQLSTSSPAFGAWLMPFLVDNHQQAFELWKTDESMALFNTLTNENVVGLGYASSGFRYLLATKPIETAKDLENMKIRTTPSPTILDFWNPLKVSPTPMPLTEVYTALQTGVIDGVDIDTESLVTENLSEIAKHMTPSKHMYWAAGILVNKDRWNSFSDEEKELVHAAVQTAMEKNVAFIEENEANLDANGETELGVTKHALANPAEFDAVVKSVEDKWSSQSPEIAAFLKKAKEITGKQ